MHGIKRQGTAAEQEITKLLTPTTFYAEIYRELQAFLNVFCVGWKCGMLRAVKIGKKNP